jgi:hypothetical protein
LRGYYGNRGKQQIVAPIAFYIRARSVSSLIEEVAVRLVGVATVSNAPYP